MAFIFPRSAASPGQSREKTEMMEKKAKQGLKWPNRFNRLEIPVVYFGGRDNTKLITQHRLLCSTVVDVAPLITHTVTRQLYRNLNIMLTFLFIPNEQARDGG